MKNIIVGLLVLLSYKAHSQIVLEQIYSTNNTKDLLVVNFGYDDYKYILLDLYNNQFDIYNVDHTPFQLGITTPISLDSGVISPGYFSWSLFDCDSTNIEYAIWNPTSLGSFYVYRLDGTLLFQKDSVIAPYCYGCYGGSNEKKPIYNTSNGAKLMLMNSPQYDFLIYDLCGELPLQITPVENDSYSLKYFPNPTSNSITFEFGEQFGNGKSSVTVFDSKMLQVQKSYLPNDGKVEINTTNLASGQYFFVLKAYNNVVRSGKFIVTK